VRVLCFLGAALLAGCAPQPKKVELPADVTLAQATVKTYFNLIGQRKYGEAYRMWGNDGGDTRGTAAEFANSFEPYRSYIAEVGDPTDIKTSAGQDYIAVTTKVRVTLKQSGETSDRSGPVLLRRPTGARQAWRIWGTDIRGRN
jgi:hypothetical protein